MTGYGSSTGPRPRSLGTPRAWQGPASQATWECAGHHAQSAFAGSESTPCPAEAGAPLETWNSWGSFLWPLGLCPHTALQISLNNWASLLSPSGRALMPIGLQPLTLLTQKSGFGIFKIKNRDLRGLGI